MLAARQLARSARQLTPAGVAERLGGLGEAFQDFVDDVRAGMAERELELLAMLEEHGQGQAVKNRAPDRDGKGEY
ncbi:hypothetical protein LI90_1695 [Carbonactinospora thermoautotrophica]|uniref:Uncharacterized protein n=1 Tax=Carbonactinospora thermoautotrophica TaxID=1469144 RepID=A0A132MTG8_9ACTN|nr:hypothetical protein LI90_1695 [Carbonactinospora thermoautotrophica]